MIKLPERFLSEGQGYFGPRENPKTETHCNVWDWGQLRMIKVNRTAKLFPPEEDIECPVLAQFADFLSKDVTAVTVDDEGLLTGISTDPEEDDTVFIGYLPFSSVESLAGCRVIQDIAPRNLLIDPDTQKLLHFDFDWVASGKTG